MTSNAAKQIIFTQYGPSGIVQQYVENGVTKTVTQSLDLLEFLEPSNSGDIIQWNGSKWESAPMQSLPVPITFDGEQIKTAYEAEPNAYTDTKDTKLTGIATGATNYGDVDVDSHIGLKNTGGGFLGLHPTINVIDHTTTGSGHFFKSSGAGNMQLVLINAVSSGGGRFGVNAANQCFMANLDGDGLRFINGLGGGTEVMDFDSGTDKWIMYKRLDMLANNIITAGLVDGRNVGADGTKLDTIASNATNYGDADVTTLIGSKDAPDGFLGIAADSSVTISGNNPFVRMNQPVGGVGCPRFEMSRLGVLKADMGTVCVNEQGMAGTVVDDMWIKSVGTLFLGGDYTKALTMNNTQIQAFLPIVTSSTVDGRDVGADGTKLDGIEAGSNYARLGGRAGGQVLSGGTAAAECMKISSTTHATKGCIVLNDVGYASPYQTSVQSTNPATWMEILNNTGANNGCFFGLEGADFELWSYNGGDLKMYTGPAAGNATLALSVKANGNVKIENGELELGTVAKFPTGVAAAGVANNSLFRDSVDDKLKFKDNVGAVNLLY